MLFTSFSDSMIFLLERIYYGYSISELAELQTREGIILMLSFFS